MELGLKGKNVLVTGGSKGIGLACAQTMLREGANVAIVSRDRGNIAAALARLGGATGIVADLVDPEAARSAVDEAERALGPIDILVNSAGAAARTMPDELTAEAWRRAMDAKFFTYIHVIDPLVKRMADRGRGVIINITGHGGKLASSTHLPGGSANAALMLASAGLGAAYGPRGVRVVGLSPGRVDTERVQRALEIEARLTGTDVETARGNAVGSIPLGRLATPEEIASIVAFAASDAASYLTGVNISVDGGQTPFIV